LVLIIGGHYTYADVPFFEDWGERNNYDKLGILCRVFLLL
jgi:putative membrane protein